MQPQKCITYSIRHKTMHCTLHTHTVDRQVQIPRRWRAARRRGRIRGDVVEHLRDSKSTVRGYCLDIPRFEESLNNQKQYKASLEEQGIWVEEWIDRVLETPGHRELREQVDDRLARDGNIRRPRAVQETQIQSPFQKWKHNSKKHTSLDSWSLGLWWFLCLGLLTSVGRLGMQTGWDERTFGQLSYRFLRNGVLDFFVGFYRLSYFQKSLEKDLGSFLVPQSKSQTSWDP